MMVRWTNWTRGHVLGGDRSAPSTRAGSSTSTDALPTGSTERGALLRGEGLYTSHIAGWRKAREGGAREGLAPKHKVRRSPEQVELDRARRRIERLEAELERTKTALEITGKVHALLEQLSESADSDPKSKP